MYSGWAPTLYANGVGLNEWTSVNANITATYEQVPWDASAYVLQAEPLTTGTVLETHVDAEINEDLNVIVRGFNRWFSSTSDDPGCTLDFEFWEGDTTIEASSVLDYPDSDTWTYGWANVTVSVQIDAIVIRASCSSTVTMSQWAGIGVFIDPVVACE